MIKELKIASILFLLMGLFSCTEFSLIIKPPPEPPDPPVTDEIFLYAGETKIGEILKGQDFASKYLWVMSPNKYFISVSSSSRVYELERPEINIKKDTLGFASEISGIKPVSDDTKKILNPYLEEFEDKARVLVVLFGDSASEVFYVLVDISKTKIQVDYGKAMRIIGYNYSFSCPKYQPNASPMHDVNLAKASTSDRFSAEFPQGWAHSEMFTIRDSNGTVIQNWPESLDS